MTQIRPDQVRGGVMTQAQADLLYAALVHQHLEDDILDLTHSAEALRDILVADVVPEEGQVLRLVDGQWAPATLEGGGSSVDTLDDLSDVDAASPSDGQALVWSVSAQKWAPVTLEGGGSSVDTLDDLSDVDAASPSDGQALVWSVSAQKWAPATVEVTAAVAGCCEPLVDDAGELLFDETFDICVEG